MAPPSEPGKSRTRLFALLGVAVVFVVALALVALVVLGGDDDGANGGSSDSELRVPNGQVLPLWGKAPSEAPEQVWRAELECDDQCDIAVDNELAFTTQGEDGDMWVEAFDLETGESAWKNTSIDAGDFGMYVDRYQDLLTVDTQHEEGGSRLTVLDPETGEQRWEADGSFLGFVGDGKLLLGRSEGEERTTVAVNMDDGEEQWTSEGSPVGLCNGNAVLARSREVVVLDVGSGDRAWQAPAADPDKATCAGNRVFVLSGGGVTAFDLANGDRAWRANVKGADSVAGAEDLAVVLGSDERVAFEISGGKVRWRKDLSEDDKERDFLLPVGEGRALALSDDDMAPLVLEDGTVGPEGPNPDLSRPTQDAIILVDEDTDRLRAVDLQTLEELWEGPRVVAAEDLEASGGRVIILVDDGITAFG